MVHTDDVVDAIDGTATQGGAFNRPPVRVTTAAIASALCARAVHVPAAVARAAMSGCLARPDPAGRSGWLDLGMAVPLARQPPARHTRLGWSPSVDALTALRETVAGCRGLLRPDAVLRPRTVLGQLGN
jgi:hypothetical protein